MPLIKLKDIDDTTRLGIWKAEEDLSYFEQRLPNGYLNGDDHKRFGERRKLEYFASRYLVFQLLKDKNLVLSKDEYGKPYIQNHPAQLSISHTANLVAAMISEKNIALDIEQRHSKVQLVMHKFLGEEELDFFEAEPDIDKLVLCWSAKESLYKLHGKKGIDFRKHILLDNPEVGESGHFKGWLLNGKGSKTFNINYEKISGSYLTYIVDTHSPDS